MKKIFIMLLLLGICLPVIAASWIDIGCKQYMMIEKVEGKSVYYWVKALNDGTFEKEKNQIPAYKMFYTNSDCLNDKYKPLALYVYSSKGNVLSSFEDDNNYISYKTPVPQSKGAFWHKLACYAVTGK